MTAQSRKKWIIGRRVFHRMPSGTGSRQRQVFGKTSRSDQMHRACVTRKVGVHSPGFAKHMGQFGVDLGTACIRRKLSARRGCAVHGSC
jgi:hypothetical protein